MRWIHAHIVLAMSASCKQDVLGNGSFSAPCYVKLRLENGKIEDYRNFI